MKQIDSSTATTIHFKRSNYGCLIVVVLFLTIPTYIIFYKAPLFAYLVISLKSSVAIGVGVILVFWSLLLWVFVYAIAKMLADAPVVMHLDKQGIWTEQFYKRNSYLFKWQDIVEVQQNTAEVLICYYEGHRYLYRKQNYEYVLWQRQTYYKPTRAKVATHTLPKRMVGYDEHEWMRLLQHYFDTYGQTTNSGET